MFYVVYTNKQQRHQNSSIYFRFNKGKEKPRSVFRIIYAMWWSNEWKHSKFVISSACTYTHTHIYKYICMQCTCMRLCCWKICARCYSIVVLYCSFGRPKPRRNPVWSIHTTYMSIYCACVCEQLVIKQKTNANNGAESTESNGNVNVWKEKTNRAKCIKFKFISNGNKPKRQRHRQQWLGFRLGFNVIVTQTDRYRVSNNYTCCTVQLR